MGMLKRFVAIILVFCLFSTLSDVVLAEDEEQTAEYVDMMSDKAMILKALDIIEDGKYEKNAGVTRSEFANAVVMTVNETAPQGQAEYDMSADDGGLYWLMKNDLVHGNGTGEFRPNEEITISEAVKISLSILGYTQYAEIDGGYPLGYISLAKRYGILDGVSGSMDDVLTYDSFLNIVYNITECDVMDTVLVSSEGYSEYAVRNGKTLLSVYRNIYKGKGIVEADEVSGLYSELEVSDIKKIRISGTEYDAEAIYTENKELLGLNTVFYYRDINGDAKTMIYIAPFDNKTIEISSDDIVSYNSGTYTYQLDNQRTQTIALNGNIIILYNGAYSENNQRFVPNTGRIVLADNNKDGVYDVLKIYESKIVIAERAVKTGGNYTIFDKYDSEYNEIISDYINVQHRVYDADGKEISIDRINSGNVLEIIKTATSRPFYKINVTTTAVSDIITSVDSAHKYLKLASGETLETSPRFRELITDRDIAVEHNSPCMIYLTADGKAAYIDYSGEAVSPLTYRVGYLYDFGYEDDAFLTIPRVRMLDEGGEWHTYYFAKSVKLKNGSMRAEKLDFSSNESGLCRYMLNIKGEISEIYFPAPLPQDASQVDMDEKFQLIYSGNGRYKYYAGGFAIGAADRIIRVASTMKVFIQFEAKDGASLSENNIKVTGYDILTDGLSYQFEIYNYSSKPGTGDVGLVKMGNMEPPLERRQARPMVVSEILETMTDDGDIVYSVSGLKNGSPVSVNVEDRRQDDSVFPIKSGDVVYLLPDVNGIVTLRDDYVSGGTSKGYSYGVLCGYDSNGTLKAYTTSAGELIQGSWGIYLGDNNTSRQDRTLLGKVYDVSDTHIYVNCGSVAADWSRVEPFNIASGQVYVYDEAAETFKVGSVAESVCARHDPLNASDVYVVAANGYQVIVIYP